MTSVSELLTAAEDLSDADRRELARQLLAKKDAPPLSLTYIKSIVQEEGDILLRFDVLNSLPAPFLVTRVQYETPNQAGQLGVPMFLCPPLREVPLELVFPTREVKIILRGFRLPENATEEPGGVYSATAPLRKAGV